MVGTGGVATLEVAGRPVHVAVRRSQRAKRARVVVVPGQPLEVVLPRRAPASEVPRLLVELRPWIERKVSWAREVEARAPSLGLDTPGVVWVDARAIPVARVPGGSRSTARLDDDRLVVTGPDAAAVDAVRRWYRREAKRVVEARVRHHHARLGIDAAVQRVTIRDPSSRWGSCSRAGSLSFSWRLLLGPREVLDYVVIHELCHLRHPNHSTRFWRMVDAACPDRRAYVAWLRDFGWELHAHEPRLLAPANG